MALLLVVTSILCVAAVCYELADIRKYARRTTEQDKRIDSLERDLLALRARIELAQEKD